MVLCLIRLFSVHTKLVNIIKPNRTFSFDNKKELLYREALN